MHNIYIEILTDTWYNDILKHYFDGENKDGNTIKKSSRI